MKYITRKLRDDMKCDKMLVKAMAFSILVKQRTTSSTIKNCTNNKLHNLTGLHANTIKQYMLKLAEFNLITEQPNGTVVFKTLSHHSQSGNMPPLDFDKFSNVTDITYALYLVLLMEEIKNKEYVKNLIRIANNPSKGENFKAARKKCREKHYPNQYTENGISYEGYSKRIGVCKETAQTIIQFGIEHRIIEKHCRQIQVPIWGLSKKVPNIDAFKETFGITFCTKHNAYKVLANTYTIVDDENRVYEVNATDDVNLPKWQTTVNLYVEVPENEENDTIRPQKSSKKRKNMSKNDLKNGFSCKNKGLQQENNDNSHSLNVLLHSPHTLLEENISIGNIRC